MNLAEIPESLITLNNLAPEKAQAHLKEFIANSDRMKMCKLLMQHVHENPTQGNYLTSYPNLLTQHGGRGTLSPKSKLTTFSRSLLFVFNSL